jgi:uncharacterized lipoprotein YehR (DUF1307 family)
MKKLILMLLSLLLTFSLAFSLAACGEAEAPENGGEANQNQNEK